MDPVSFSNHNSFQHQPNFFSNIVQNHPLLTSSLLTVGSLSMTFVSFRAFKYLSSVNFFFPKSATHLQTRYGNNSWALVTGATDGLGKAFAFKLAQANFNLILLGRSESKMATVIDELNASGLKVQCEKIIFDLKNANKTDELNLLLSEKLENKDLSILVNNAGLTSTEQAEEVSEQEILDMISVNCLAPALITKRILPALKKREGKSAIINVSSFTGVNPMPFTAVYSGTKAFLDAFSKSVAIEEREKIDVLSLTPYYISTKMTRHQKVNFETRTAEDVVEGCLRDLGKRDRSFGHFNHEMIHFYNRIAPERVIENQQRDRMMEVVKKIRLIKEALARKSKRREKTTE